MQASRQWHSSCDTRSDLRSRCSYVIFLGLLHFGLDDRGGYQTFKHSRTKHNSWSGVTIILPMQWCRMWDGLHAHVCPRVLAYLCGCACRCTCVHWMPFWTSHFRRLNRTLWRGVSSQHPKPSQGCCWKNAFFWIRHLHRLQPVQSWLHFWRLEVPDGGSQWANGCELLDSSYYPVASCKMSCIGMSKKIKGYWNWKICQNMWKMLETVEKNWSATKGKDIVLLPLVWPKSAGGCLKHLQRCSTRIWIPWETAHSESSELHY